MADPTDLLKGFHTFEGRLDWLVVDTMQSGLNGLDKLGAVGTAFQMVDERLDGSLVALLRARRRHLRQADLAKSSRSAGLQRKDKI